MKTASWIVTGVFALLFILRVIAIINSHDYFNYLSAAIAGTFTACAIIPIIMWIITYIVTKKKNK